MALRLKFPGLNFGARLMALAGSWGSLVHGLKALLIKGGDFARTHKRGALLVWLAFLAGLVGADVWISMQRPLPEPIAAVELGPVPAPLVAGRDPQDRPLSAAPLPELIETQAEGRLPVVSASGLAPYQAYAYPFDPNDARPRISIVLLDVGMQSDFLAQAMRKLPGSVGLAFSAYTPELDKAFTTARQAGHETYLMVPADGLNDTLNTGPGALRNSLPAGDNIQRLRLLMGRGYGYAGLVLDPRTAILNTANLAGALLTEGQNRGLLLLSGNPDFTSLGRAQGSPSSTISVALDRDLDPAAVDIALAELEQRAREGGHVIATTALYPFLIDKLALWLPTLADKGIVIAPATSSLPQTSIPAIPSTPEHMPAPSPAETAPHH